MFIDSSAIVAILAEEGDATVLARNLGGATAAITSPIAVYESSLALSRIQKSDLESVLEDVLEFLRESGIRVIGITPGVGEEAVATFGRFGKGRHRAGLNMGDCFAYACAKAHDVPLLCKGNDFVHTDIKLA